MKRIIFPLIAVLGFVAGWNLPKAESAPASSSSPASGEGPRHELKKRALRDTLLFEEEREAHRMHSASIAEILVSMKGNRHMQEGGEEHIEDNIARLIELGPAAAMDAMLANPITDPDHVRTLVLTWAEKQPDEALRYLRARNKSYVVQDCIEALLEAQAEPEEEQEQPNGTASTPSEPEKEDESEKPANESPPPPAAPKETVKWDPATYNAEDSMQQEALRNDLREKPQETVARIGETGSRALCRETMDVIVAGFSRDPETWPEESRKLETAIQQLGVIPEDPPTGFEIGPQGLDGSQVGSWLDRQPLALRRAWAPAIMDRWTQADPQAAMKWASALPEDASRNQSIQTGVIVWTHRDPSAAIAYVDALPAGDLREVAISNAAASWNCIDPTAAKKWVEALPDSPGKQRAKQRLKR